MASMPARSAAEWKAEGNAHFGAKRYVDAAEAYSQAIACEPDAVFFSNRCACQLKLGQLDAALADALRARELRPTWAKAHFREGSVLTAMGRHADAARSLCEALQLEPSAEAAAELRATMHAGGLHDAPDQQHLLQRCLLLLARGPTGARSVGDTRAELGAWKRCVLPSAEGPRPRAGATLDMIGSTLWLIGGLDARASAESTQSVTYSDADGIVHCLNTAVEPAAWTAEPTRAADGASHAPVARAGHASCVRGSEIWLFGGHTTSGDPLADTHALDTRTCAWRLVDADSAPVARHAHTLCHDGGDGAGASDRLLVFGGANAASEPLGDLCELDLGEPALRWRPVATAGPPPSPREMHACAIVSSPSAAGGEARAPGASAGVLLIHGGRSGTRVLNDLWILHLGTHTWQCVISPHARCSHALSARPALAGRAAAGTAQFIAFGGFDGRGVLDSTLLLTLAPARDGELGFDVLWADVSADLTGAPKARFAHAQAGTARAVYVFGGGGASGGCLADTNKLTLTLDAGARS
ncbi:hypothetical protein KFE25_007514 [Diacronema lutheri]|uniref:Uncharacterized protein n=2 Tax=Diacronema lutheri TaxID=2081491 RepID=A0A8J6CFD3_DIALT|nr:hypothetical protein KFE25_007514 [Diacronema lutheri]